MIETNKIISQKRQPWSFLFNRCRLVLVYYLATQIYKNYDNIHDANICFLPTYLIPSNKLLGNLQDLVLSMQG